MPEMTIRLIPDPETGKKNIIISLRGDEDALPHEHEQMHRKLVDKVINGGLVKAAELGQITVEREEDQRAPNTPNQAPANQEREAVKQGGSGS